MHLVGYLKEKRKFVFVNLDEDFEYRNCYSDKSRSRYTGAVK